MNKSDARITLRKAPDSPGIAAKIHAVAADLRRHDHPEHRASGKLT
jgi:hypothetical protein